jgi:hypothetical protein
VAAGRTTCDDQCRSASVVSASRTQAVSAFGRGTATSFVVRSQ